MVELGVPCVVLTAGVEAGTKVLFMVGTEAGTNVLRKLPYMLSRSLVLLTEDEDDD
jgi:hypothetical protein